MFSKYAVGRPAYYDNLTNNCNAYFNSVEVPVSEKCCWQFASVTSTSQDPTSTSNPIENIDVGGTWPSNCSVFILFQQINMAVVHVIEIYVFIWVCWPANAFAACVYERRGKYESISRKSIYFRPKSKCSIFVLPQRGKATLSSGWRSVRNT